MMVTLSGRVPVASWPCAPPTPATAWDPPRGEFRDPLGGAAESRTRSVSRTRAPPACLSSRGDREGGGSFGRAFPKRKPAGVEPGIEWLRSGCGSLWTPKRKLERLTEERARVGSQEIGYGETLSESLHLSFPPGKHRCQFDLQSQGPAE